MGSPLVSSAADNLHGPANESCVMLFLRSPWLASLSPLQHALLRRDYDNSDGLDNDAQRHGRRPHRPRRPAGGRTVRSALLDTSTTSRRLLKRFVRCEQVVVASSCRSAASAESAFPGSGRGRSAAERRELVRSRIRLSTSGAKLTVVTFAATTNESERSQRATERRNELQPRPRVRQLPDIRFPSHGSPASHPVRILALAYSTVHTLASFPRNRNSLSSLLPSRPSAAALNLRRCVRFFSSMTSRKRLQRVFDVALS